MRSGETFGAIKNRAYILNLIRVNESIFRAELARLTGLTIPTVTTIVDELIEKGLVVDLGEAERVVGKTIGKTPRILKFVPNSFHIIGVDMGATNLTAIVMDLSARVIYKQIVQTDISGGAECVTAQVESLVEQAMAFLSTENRKCLGIGVGMSGLLDSLNGIVRFSPGFSWENVELVKSLSAKFNLPVIMNNVTRCMALAEQLFGAAKGVDNFICVNLGIGVGAAMVLNGELYLGESESSGELGHMTLERNGPPCKCGNYGCLEALASGNAIAKKMADHIANGRQTILAENTGKGAIDAKMVFDAARKGDYLSSEVVREAIDYIGIALANAVNFMDPKLIVLLGGMTKAGDVLLKGVENSVATHKMKYAGANCRIEFGQLGENATAVGAAAFFLKKLINSGGNWTPEAETI